MFATMAKGSLTEERLESIERGARERHTLMDRVVLELVEEVRRLRGIIARTEEQQGTTKGVPPTSGQRPGPPSGLDPEGTPRSGRGRAFLGTPSYRCRH